MAGIYVHIPFCKKACHYCDFHFSTSLKNKAELLRALHIELRLRKTYLSGKTVHTIYFGGGTPSLLTPVEINELIDTISIGFKVDPNAEITLEANPDDLNQAMVQALRGTAINRFSVGIQSFYEEDLAWMNRAHGAGEAETALKRLQDAGFENITADLIYGYPLLSEKKLESNIQKLISFKIPHISAYSMTVEPRTVLASLIKKGFDDAPNDSQSARHYKILIQRLVTACFEHYETSNFAIPGSYSKHNTNYWKGEHYLGVGPSAHSYNGDEREWNVANNAKYVQAISNGDIPSQIEHLTVKDRVNEYIMTSLRTMWGMDLGKITGEFGIEIGNQILKSLKKVEGRSLITIENDIVKLTEQGKLFADRISSDLFIT